MQHQDSIEDSTEDSTEQSTGQSIEQRTEDSIEDSIEDSTETVLQQPQLLPRPQLFAQTPVQPLAFSPSLWPQPFAFAFGSVVCPSCKPQPLAPAPDPSL